MAIDQRERSQIPEHQIDFDKLFDQMARVMRELDIMDLQADRVRSLERELRETVAGLMKNPAASMAGEFEWLERLYTGRTISSEGQLGAHYDEFVTRNADDGTIDHHFRKITYPNGAQLLCDSTRFRDSLMTPMHFMLQEGQIRVTQERSFGSDIVLQGDAKKYALERFFLDTVTATGLMLDRGSDEIEQANEQALDLIAAQ